MILELKQQVCRLELSQQLKGLGVPQESIWYWYDGKLSLQSMGQFMAGFSYDDKKCYSAFTVTELGELLPKDKTLIFRKEKYYGDKQDDMWVAIYCEDNKNVDINLKNNLWFSGYAEVNARAKMLIYLIENKLIKL